MLDHVNAVVDHGAGCFLGKLGINEGIGPCGLDFDVRIDGLCAVLESVDDLHKGVALDRSDASHFAALAHHGRDHAFHVRGLLTRHHVGSDIISLGIRLGADKQDIRILLGNLKRRITELKTVSDDDIIIRTCVIRECGSDISGLQILGIGELHPVLLAGFERAFVSGLVPSLVIGGAGHAQRDLQRLCFIRLDGDCACGHGSSHDSRHQNP